MDTIEFVESELPWFLPAFAFILGAIVGSFLNVCIYRIPAKKSIVSPGSTCACGTPIKWHDNIPILSWFILRGKARCCGSPYSFRYPFVEALTGFLFLAAWEAHPPIKAICIMLFASLLICGSFIDLDHMEIPDRFSIGLAVIGIAISVLAPELHDLPRSDFALASINSLFRAMIGLLVGSGTILWIALLAEVVLKKEAMGFGDVKLLGGIGAFLGWQGAIFSIFGGATLGCIGILVWTIIKKLSGRKPKGSEDAAVAGRHIPFGPMLSGGALLYSLFLETAVNLYFAQFLPIFQHFAR